MCTYIKLISPDYLLKILLDKPPFRFWIAALVFYTTFTLYSFRINLSIGIIDMAGRTQKTPYCSEENQERSSSDVQQYVY